MKRRDFCTTTTVAAIGLTANQAKSQPEVRKREFRDKVYKSVKWGGKVNMDRLRKLKDLGFDGIEGSAPGMDTEGLRKLVPKSIFPWESFTTSTGRCVFPHPTLKPEKLAVKALKRQCVNPRL